MSPSSLIGNDRNGHHVYVFLARCISCFVDHIHGKSLDSLGGLSYISPPFFFLRTFAMNTY